MDFRAEFAAAEAILDALEAGKDPFAGKHGDSHRAYRSPVDQSLQPYRIFVPAKYDCSSITSCGNVSPLLPRLRRNARAVR